MKGTRHNDPEAVARNPQYRPPPYEDLSDLVKGRQQAGPQSTPPREIGRASGRDRVCTDV